MAVGDAQEPGKDRRIRFALVGCGRIAKNHFGAIKAHAKRCDLVDVCDSDSARLAEAVAETGAAGHSNLDRMLADPTASAGTTGTAGTIAPGGTVTIDRDRLLQLRQQLNALLAALSKR